MKIAVIGGALIDIVSQSEHTLLNNDSTPGRTTFNLGGVGKNIAETLALLGEPVTFISTLGDDAFSDLLYNRCLEVGMNLEYIHRITAPSSSYTALFDASGSLVHGIADTKTAAILPPNYEEALNTAEIVVIASNFDAETTCNIIRQFKDKRLVVDPISIKKTSLYIDVLPYIHTLKCNQLEASVLCGFDILSLDSIPDAASEIIRRGVKEVFITLGELGSYYSNGTDFGFMHSEPTEIINVSGAGDAYTAGVVMGMHHQFSIEETAAFSSLLATFALKSEHPVLPSLKKALGDHLSL